MENNNEFISEEFISEVLKRIQTVKNSIKINGTKFSEGQNERFLLVKEQCEKLFPDSIIVENPTQDMPFASVEAKLDSLFLTQENKKQFIKLIELAEEIMFDAENDEHQISLTFFVNDIWTE